VAYRLSLVDSFPSLDEADWNTLQTRDNPFLSYAFLSHLERTGSVGAHNGWQPHHLALHDDNGLAAFMPAWIKTHSRGEFVFDWSWADAYHRHGRNYYPKLLCGIPWSPITGPRLLTRGATDNESLKTALAEHAVAQCADHELSSLHCNFVRPEDEPFLESGGMLARHDWQFHWHNHGYAGFDDFLDALKSRKRKAIRRERRRVVEQGIEFDWKTGTELDEEDLAFVYRCYVSTFAHYGNHPALTPDFFAEIARDMGSAVRVVFALRDGQPLAMGFFLLGGGRLYGRYWGCTEELSGLHFETAYYQGIELCIREKLDVFESGAQGEHKIARGFVPVATRSYHYIAAEDFRRAIADYLQKERAWMNDYRRQLHRHDPYRERST
jgi:predicted N-acyltransferase